MGLEALKQRMPFLRSRDVDAIAPILSSYVLIQGGQERRLTVGERVSLSTRSTESAEDRITFFAVSSTSDHLDLHIGRERSYVSPIWGFAAETLGGKEKKFGIHLRAASLDIQDGRTYIKDSNMYFDEQDTRLHGEGWALEYRPITT